MKEEHILIIGTIGFVYFPLLIFSFLKIIKRKYAILITDEFLIDNSKFESIGSIEWKSISNIKRLKKKSIELDIIKSVLQKRKMNLLEKFFAFMHNWNYKESIIISSALIDCSIEELYETISETWENNKLN
ncbi:hypothetical protein ULMA_12370 [Patiriisocius marinus]|uniref:Uncharacterized protein n=2 Tax=Patiriisocius marinus TaxID=1397112 RepID=A0A5J4INR8_9FLAO|nr:hypothetical protein ULMA_12370 [Patiriisocius marinus]